MKLNPTILGLIALFSGAGNAVPTWPSAIDELEDVMFLHTGYRNRGLASHVTPCSFSEFGPGRQTAAEWLRLGFHDMATANAFQEPKGGIDGSIGFELNNGENVGTGFTTSLTTFGGFLNKQLSMADMIALGVHASVRACGGPLIPMRGGRKDATAAGPIGVPQPADGTSVFKNRFLRMGFNTVEMIQMTACGHTLGGVHSANFPDIVPPGTAPDGYQLFDSTLAFDNKIATRYIDGPDTNPLSTGRIPGKRSDLAVFVADSNVTLKAMKDAATFNTMCTSILQKMIEVVPTNTVLSDIIQPYEVKPAGLQLTLLSGGTQIKFAGDIRVRTTVRSASQIASVKVVYKNRSGGTGGTITASVVGAAAGFDDNFSFYSFSSDLPASTSISSFIVTVTLTGGTTETYDNNGSEFPIQDSVIVQTPQSCLSNGNLTVVAAVRSGVTAPGLVITQKTARTNGVPMPQLVENTVAMVQGASIGSYSLYSATFTIASGAATKFGVSSGSFADSFKDAADLGVTCAPLGSTPSSSSSSSTASSTSSSPSASSTPTLRHPPVVGAYTFQGCYTEIAEGRALTGGVFYDSAMTMEKCATNCAAFTYFGVEYGQECFCGNTLAPASSLAAIGDCNFICPGNQYQYCGAGNRMELYKKTSEISNSSSVSSTSTTSLSSSSTTSTMTGSSTSTSSTPTLHIVPSVGVYNYHGCFTESTGVRALSAAFYPSDTLTIEDCVAACSPYKYAGAEYGRECFCADSFSAGSVIAPDNECSMTCAGNQYQYCGGGNRLTVYIRNGTSGGVSSSSSGTTTSGPSTTLSTSILATTTSQSSTTSKSSTTSSGTSSAPSSLYTSDGCYTDSTANRALNGAYYVDNLMTVPKCEALCSGFSYYGLEYGAECWCGNSLNGGTVKTASSECSFPCPGDNSQFCGAGDRLDVYHLAQPGSTASSSPTTTAPSIKPTIGAYKYYGCQTEATNMRALTGAVSYNSTSMTLEMCAGNCVGFKYWGVEYGAECYCGNTWNAGSVDAPGGDADCSFGCPGDKTEFCGAGNRLSAYELE